MQVVWHARVRFNVHFHFNVNDILMICWILFHDCLLIVFTDLLMICWWFFMIFWCSCIWIRMCIFISMASCMCIYMFICILPRKVATSRPKIWKFALKCMREQKWCQTKLPTWAMFRPLGKTYYFLHSTRRECPPISGGFEANLGMETSSCTRYLRKSLFENMLPTGGGEHIFKTNAKT